MESGHIIQGNTMHQRSKEVWRIVEGVNLQNRSIDGTKSQATQQLAHNFTHSIGTDAVSAQSSSNQHNVESRGNSRLRSQDYVNPRSNNRMFNSHHGGSGNSSDSEIHEKSHLENGLEPSGIVPLLQQHIPQQSQYSQGYHQQGKGQHPVQQHLQRNNYQSNQFSQRFQQQSQQMNAQRNSIQQQTQRIQQYQQKPQQHLLNQQRNQQFQIQHQNQLTQQNAQSHSQMQQHLNFQQQEQQQQQQQNDVQKIQPEEQQSNQQEQLVDNKLQDQSTNSETRPQDEKNQEDVIHAGNGKPESMHGEKSQAAEATEMLNESDDDELQRMIQEAVLNREKACRVEAEVKAKLMAINEIRNIRAEFEKDRKIFAETEASLKSELNDFEGKCTEKDETIHRLQQQLQSLEQELKLNQEKIKEKVWQEGQLREKNTELLQLRMERDNAVAEKQMLSAQHETDRNEFVSQLEQLKQDIESKEQQLHDTQEQLRLTQEELWSKEDQIRESQAWFTHYQEMEMHVSNYASANQSLQAELRERIGQYSQLYDMNQQQRHQYESNDRYHIQIIQRLQKENAEMKEQLRQYLASTSDSSKVFSSNGVNANGNTVIGPRVHSDDSNSHKSSNSLLQRDSRVPVSPAIPPLANPILSPFGIPQPVVVPPMPPVGTALQFTQPLIPSQIPPVIPMQQPHLAVPQSSSMQQQPIFHPMQNPSLNQHQAVGKNGSPNQAHMHNQNPQANFIRTSQPPIQPPIQPPQHHQQQQSPTSKSASHHTQYHHPHQQDHKQESSQQKQHNQHSQPQVSPPSHLTSELLSNVGPEMDQSAGMEDSINISSMQKNVSESNETILQPEPQQLQHQQGISAGMDHLNVNAMPFSNQSPHITLQQANHQNHQQAEDNNSVDSHNAINDENLSSLINKQQQQQNNNQSSFQQEQLTSSSQQNAENNETLSKDHNSFTDGSESQTDGEREFHNMRSVSSANSVTSVNDGSSNMQLMDEHSLLTCLVRTLAAEPSMKVHVATTVSKRLSKLLDPLTWNDYELRHGSLENFISHHPELFVVVDGSYVYLQEGARAYLASTKPSLPLSSPIIPSGRDSSKTLLAVTPMAPHLSLQQQQKQQKISHIKKTASTTVPSDVPMDSSIGSFSAPSSSSLGVNRSAGNEEGTERSPQDTPIAKLESNDLATSNSNSKISDVKAVSDSAYQNGRYYPSSRA